MPEDVGVALIAANCVVALLVIIIVGRSVGDISTELDELRLVFQDDGAVVRLPLPEDEDQGTHLYLSHAWWHAQEQCGTVKSLLYTMLPTCRVFLEDDDHASEAEIEEHVRHSSVFLAFLTSEYALRSLPPTCASSPTLAPQRFHVATIL